MELPQNDENSLMDTLGLDHIESIEKRPSEGLPLKKKAGTNRDITNTTYNDLLK
jgi:DNA mismatch repair protein MutH